MNHYTLNSRHPLTALMRTPFRPHFGLSNADVEKLLKVDRNSVPDITLRATREAIQEIFTVLETHYPNLQKVLLNSGFKVVLSKDPQFYAEVVHEDLLKGQRLQAAWSNLVQALRDRHQNNFSDFLNEHPTCPKACKNIRNFNEFNPITTPDVKAFIPYWAKHSFQVSELSSCFDILTGKAHLFESCLSHSAQASKGDYETLLKERTKNTLIHELAHFIDVEIGRKEASKWKKPFSQTPDFIQIVVNKDLKDALHPPRPSNKTRSGGLWEHYLPKDEEDTEALGEVFAEALAITLGFEGAIPISQFTGLYRNTLQWVYTNIRPKLMTLQPNRYHA